MLLDSMGDIELKMMELSDFIYQNTSGKIQEIKVDKVLFNKFRHSVE